jgi:hypothetical protein
MPVSLGADVEAAEVESVPATVVFVPEVPTTPDVDDPLAQAPSANASVVAATAVPRRSRCWGMASSLVDR